LNVAFMGGRFDPVFAIDWCPDCGALCERLYGRPRRGLHWRFVRPLIAQSSSTAAPPKKHARAAGAQREKARKRRRAS
jgi:hypothetical protein